MIRYIARHLNLLVITLLILSLFSFWLAYLFPGDPLTNLSGATGLSQDDYIALAQHYHMDKSFLEQYWQYMVRLMQGDWGMSLSSGLPLSQEIMMSLPASIELTVYAMFLSLLIGIPLGFAAGLRHHRTTDYALVSASVISYSIPVFWLALILILVFSLQLSWLPLSGRISLLFDVPHSSGFILIDIAVSDIADKSSAMLNAIQHLIMPTLSITIINTALIFKMTRRAVVEVMSSAYIQAAYTRGLGDTQVILKHGVRNVLLPILPLLAMQTTTLLTNAMIVEVIFSWPGIGDWLIQAIYQRDYPAIRAGMLAVSAIVVIITVTIDLIARLLNPRQDLVSRVTS